MEPRRPRICTCLETVRFTGFLICIITGTIILKWVIEFPIFNLALCQITTNRPVLPPQRITHRLGSVELPVRRWADTARVLQVDPGGQGHGAVVEEVDLQDHFAAGRPGARVLQVAELPRAARIGGGPLHAATQHESLLRRRLMWTDGARGGDGGRRQNVTLIQKYLWNLIRESIEEQQQGTYQLQLLWFLFNKRCPIRERERERGLER